jgi:hypothetical protein
MLREGGLPVRVRSSHIVASRSQISEMCLLGVRNL